MKRLILTLLLVISLISPVYAQNGYISGNQLFPQTITATAGENLTAGKVVSLINESGTMKAYNNPILTNTSPNGSEYTYYSTGASYYNTAVALDNSRFIVIAADSTYDPIARVGTVSGSTITWGSVTSPWEACTTEFISACLISTDKVLVVYSRGDNNTTRGVVLTISGTSITVNSLTYIDSSYEYYYNSVTKLDTDKALLVTTKASDGSAVSRVLSISGTTITVGSSFDFNITTPTSYTTCTALSSSSAVVAYKDDANGIKAQILSISGTTVSGNTEYTVIASAGAMNEGKGLSKISESKVILAFQNNGDSNKGKAVILNISGTIVTVGSLYEFASSASFVFPQYISGNTVLIAYNDSTNNLGKSLIATLNGNAITFGATSTFNNGITLHNTVCYLGNNVSTISYRDGGNNSYGTSVINTWASSAYHAVAGTAYSTVTSGNPVKIITNGFDYNQSGLLAGSPYFLQSDFTIGTTPVGLLNSMYTSATTTREVYIGTAKSTTSLFVQPDYK